MDRITMPRPGTDQGGKTHDEGGTDTATVVVTTTPIEHDAGGRYCWVLKV